MNDAERFRLLHGPYTAPALRRGDRAVCLFRDGDVVITSWSDGRIPWPRCQRPGRPGGSGLLVNEELARAIRSESSLAVQYWWGVSEDTVSRWRQALGVTQWGTEGSWRLHRHSSTKGAQQLRGRTLPPDQVERRRRTALALGLRPPPYRGEHPWTEEELALLGTVPDAELAVRLGRTENAVRLKRSRRGIPKAAGRREQPTAR